MISTEGLTKHYNKVVAVEDLNINIAKGEVYGFLGPNGAGKTTTIMMILGLTRPTRGTVKLFGHDLQKNYFEIKRKIGVLSEFHYLYDEMTAREYLNFFCSLYKVSDRERKIKRILERVNLYDRKDELLGGYSKGMRQKLSLARALLHDPEILVLDEPVSSLDPYGIKEVRDLLLEENQKGRTLFISSHILSEVERICTRVGILNKGRLLVEDTMQSIKRRVSDEVELTVEVEDLGNDIVQALEALDFVTGVARLDRQLVVKTKPEADYRGQISRAISSKGGVLLGMRAKEMSLEDAFVTITEKNVPLLAAKGGAK